METHQQQQQQEQQHLQQQQHQAMPKGVSEEKVSTERKEPAVIAGQPVGVVQGQKQQQQETTGIKKGQEQPLHGGKTGGADEGIHIQPGQPEISGLLREGHGSPDTVESSATLVTPQERLPLAHANDDAGRLPRVPADYVPTEESVGYKERLKEGSSRQP